MTIVLPLADPKVAVTVAVPWATAVTRPSLPIFASEVESQEATVVRSRVLLSVYIPVAYSCTEVPFATEGVAEVVEPCMVEMIMARRVAGGAPTEVLEQPCVNNDIVTTKSPHRIENSRFGFTIPHTQGKLTQVLARGRSSNLGLALGQTRRCRQFHPLQMI